MERIPKKIIINTTGSEGTIISDLIGVSAEPESVEKGKKFFDDEGVLQEGEAVFTGGEVVPPQLQDKSIADPITENGTKKFKPDDGYDGLSSLTIDIQVPTDTKNIQPKKTVNITKRGDGQSFKPDAGFDGLAELIANVSIPEDKKVGEKTWEVTENGDYTVYPNDGYDGISKLLASVNVPQQIINGQGGEYNIRVTVKEDDTQQLDITDADGGNGKVCVLQEKSIIIEHNDSFEVTADIGENIEWDKDLTVPTMDNPFDATQKFYYVWDKYYDFAKLLDYSITFSGGQVLTGEPVMLKDKEDKVFGYNLSDNVYVFQKGNWEKDVDGDIYTYVVPENGIYFCYLETHSYGYITTLSLPNATDFDGLSKVIVAVNVQPSLQNKEVSYNNSGTFSVTADEAYDGLQSVAITIDIPEKTPTLVSKAITENGTYRPSERKDGVIIEWDGSATYEDGTDRPYVTSGEHYKFYKVSDRFFSLDELTNVTIEQTWNDGEVTVTEKKDGEELGGYHYVMGLSGNPALRSFGPNQNTVEEGTYLTLLTYEDGRYYYVNKITLPNAQGEVVDGYNEVVVNVQPLLQEKKYSIDKNGAFEVTIGPKAIEWDGKDAEYYFNNLEGLNNGAWHLVYDQFLTQEELDGCSIVSNSGDSELGELETITGTSNNQTYAGYLINGQILSLPTSGTGDFSYGSQSWTITVPKAGIYFFKSAFGTYPTKLILPAQDNYYGLSKVNISVDIPTNGQPVKILNQAQMNELITTESTIGRIGAIYLYQGETSETYEDGALYVLEEVVE